ncbi:FecCD family ABC transporter permease [Ureaplasma urealyticum]|uniref:FecCD family ABC transporter permease n=1 Tax=Ureaplasma urealyticum TaxID=2130 RepID=UPI0002DEB850|nr:iron ABC transporter permease [Ureaplasma urealyticum]RCJ03131.1 iron ABC transporter permease [Ureaplasma urealyticum]
MHNYTFRFKLFKQIQNQTTKKLKPLILLVAAIILIATIFSIWIWNISYANFYDQTLNKYVYFSLNESLKLIFSGQFLDSSNIKYLNLQATFWASIASILSGISLAIAGCVTQALTRNPLADSSTLGIVQSSVFMIVIAFSHNIISFGGLFGFAIVGGIIASIILLILVFATRNKLSYVKITLAGLAIGVFFNTIAYFVRIQSAKGSSINFKYVLGGSENIYPTHIDPFLTLWVSAVLILIGVIIAYVLAHKLTLLEIGDEKAKNLGSSIIIVKILAIVSTIFLISPTILLVGNIAFVGLFAPHIVRKVFGIRDYRHVMPLSGLFGAMITSLGLILYRETIYINSSIWMSFIGAPVLAYLGWKHWNRA